MTRHLVTCLAIIALSFVSPTPAAAAATFAGSSAVYDTVDAVEITNNSGSGSPFIIVSGIISGQSAPSELSYQIFTSSNSGTDSAARCDRLALLAMSKPGKFQLAMNKNIDSFGFNCKLIVRAP